MRFRRGVPRISFIIGVAAACCLVSAAGLAQTPSKPLAPTAAQGKETFQQSCAICHGDRGRGNGPAASALTPRPADLSMMTKRNGTFPAAHIEAVLKGVDPTGAHTNVMMMWRALFLADANGDEAVASARVNSLVKFIESIQRK